MKWDYVNSWLLEKDLSKGLVFFVSNTIFSYSTFWERREKGYCAFYVPWTLCHSFCLNYTTGLFCGHFRLLKLFNIKNIFFPKIHWVLSVKSHLSPVKIFPSTAFLYKALITQFAESALETLRSEAWRIFFSFKVRERKEKGRYRREEKQSVKNFHCHVHLAASTMGIQGKEKKKGGKKKEEKKKEGKVGSGREK